MAFNFIATVTDQSDFGAQKNKIYHCFHFLPIYGSGSKESMCNVGDLGLISGLGKSSGGGHDNPLSLAWRIPMDRGA